VPQPPSYLRNPPDAPPVPPGLFNVAEGPLDLPDHAQTSGAVWQPDTCALALSYPTACLTPPYTAFTAQAIEPLAQAWPFAVYASMFTGRVGYDNEEAVRRVTQRVLKTEQQVAERAFWGGTTTLFTNQQNDWGTTPGAAGSAGIAGVANGILAQFAAAAPAGMYFDLGTAATVKEAVSLLEQKAADNYYGQATLHARPQIAAYAGAAGQFRVIGLPPTPEKTYMYTNNLNLWNFGNGYSGTGPTGQAVDATSEYMWATGRVIVWRDPKIWVSPPDQLLDKTTNQRGLYAFRNYMIGVECFVATIKVTRA
jgi:hypothetical protein